MQSNYSISYKPGTFAHLLREATINGVAIKAFPRPLVMGCYTLIGFGIWLAILKAIIWIALVFVVVAFFILWQYGLKPAQNLVRYLEHNPDAWMRYSGIPMETLLSDTRLLNTSVEELDRRAAKYQRALRGDLEDLRQVWAEEAEEQEEEAAPLNALEAMQQHLKSWDSSLFFAGASRSGKTSATQYYAAILKPYYFSLKPDYMPAGVQGVQGSLEEPDQLYYWLLPFYREFCYRVKNRLEQEFDLWVFIDELETDLKNLQEWQKRQPKEAPNLYEGTITMLNGILKLGNAHRVKLGIITQSVLSKNTRLDSDLMAALAWLLCGSELGGFGAFKSDRLKSRCSEQTLGQVKMMINHPDGVKGFWWLMELRGNFRLMPAPAAFPKEHLVQIDRYDINNHPFQGRSLAPEEEAQALATAEQPQAAPAPAAAPNFLQRWGVNIKTALGVEDQSAIESSQTPLEEELEKIQTAVMEYPDLQQQLGAVYPTLERIYLDGRLDLLRIARLSMCNGLITVRQIQKAGTPEMRRMRTAEVVKLLTQLDSFYYLGAIYSADAESNIAYLAFDGDDRTANI